MIRAAVAKPLKRQLANWIRSMLVIARLRPVFARSFTRRQVAVKLLPADGSQAPY
ncbi:hypothetical protein BCR44DRAFT_34047, partial [Catenaria anguillulae PL171]